MKPLKGLRRDESAEAQPQDTWRRAKNFIYKKGFIASEKGFTLEISTVNGVAQTSLVGKIIGVINTGRESVIFSVSSAGAGVGSEIGILNGTAYRTIVADTLLNFSIARPIEGVFKYKFNGQLIVVWWEGVLAQANPVRILNLTALPFLLTGFALTNPADIILADLFPPANLPVVNDIAVEDGGTLKTAAYYLIFNYEYPDGNTLGWTVPVNPVHVYDDAFSNNYNQTDGAAPGSASPKRIRVDLVNIDTSFFNLQIGYIKVENSIVTAHKANSFRITGSSMTLSINGDEVLEDIVLEDVLTPRVTYPFAKAGTILEDRLYLGNLRTRSGYDYQKYANNISINWTTGDWIGAGASRTNDVVNKGTYKEQKFTFFSKSFQADEVMAYYIAFVNKDMTLSEAYHIPGRAPLSDDNEYDLAGTAPVPVVDPELINIAGATGKRFQFYNSADRQGRMGYWENAQEKYIAGIVDSQIWDNVGVIGDLGGKNVRHHKFPSLEYLERWGYRLNQSVRNTTGVTTPGTNTEQLRHRSDDISPTSDLLNLDNNFGGVTHNQFFGTNDPVYAADHTYFRKVDDSAGNQRWRMQISEAAPAYDLNGGRQNFNRSFQNYAEDYDNGVTVNNCRIKFGYDQRVHFEWTIRFAFGVNGAASTLTYGLTHHRKDGTLVNTIVPSIGQTNPSGAVPMNVSGGTVALNFDVLKDDYLLFFVDITSNAPVGSTLNGTAPRFDNGVYNPSSIFIETISSPVYEVNNTPRSFIQPLGIDVSNVYIPQTIADNVQGFVILYAKRGSNNLSILGQSNLLANSWFDGVNINLFNSYWENTRIFDFDMLKYKIANVPTYYKAELVMACNCYRPDIANYMLTPYFIDELSHDVDKRAQPECGVLSYNAPNITQHPWSAIRKIAGFTFVPENVLITSPVALDNLSREEFGLTQFSPAFPRPPFLNQYGDGSSSDRSFGTYTYYFGNLKAYKAEMYSSFRNQQLVNTGKINLINGAGTYSSIGNFGGDVFRTPYSYRIRPDASIPAITSDEVIVTGINESASHIALRHQVPGKEYYPHEQTPNLVNASYYDYNTDYTRINDLIAIGIHDARFTKPTDFPTRIARSIVSRNEEYKISWNKFLASDYYEMPKDKGVIWKLDVRNKELMINHEFAFFVARQKDKLSTTAGEVFTGTGDIFDRLPDEILPIKGGYAGCQSQWAAFNSKNGYFFVDKKQGKMFLYNNEGLREISRDGLEQEMFIRLRDANTQDNPFTGNGLTAGYDVEHNRMIITKSGFIFNAVTKLFEPDNFTLSYSFENGAWTSNHDYYPNYLFNNREVLLSAKNNDTGADRGEVYHHNVGANGKYYGGTVYKSYIDIVFNNLTELSKILNHVRWSSDVEHITTGGNLRDKTFTHLMVYNNNQCSDIVDIRTLPNWFSNKSFNAEGWWNSNAFLDKLRSYDSPILDKDGDVLPAVVVNNKAWFEENLFIGKFGIVRFIYDNVDAHTIFLHEALADYSESAR